MRLMEAVDNWTIQEGEGAFGKVGTHCNAETSVLNAALAQANTNTEALAAHTAAQDKKNPRIKR